MNGLSPIEAYRFPDETSWPQMVEYESGEIVRVPPFSTLDNALTRAERMRSGSMREIRLSPAWGSPWPLWEKNYGPLLPSDLQLTAELSTSLRGWTEDWYQAADTALNQEIDVGLLLPPEFFSHGEVLTRYLSIELWSTCFVYPFFRRYFKSGAEK